MTLIQSHQSKSQVCFPRLSSHLLAVTMLLGVTQVAWGQDAAARWSTSNPPTPAMVHAPRNPQDNGLRRLPPIDQVGVTPPNPSSLTPSEQPADAPEIAGIPQSALLSGEKTNPVNWSSPNIVIGPETPGRMVSHEEIVDAPKRERKPSRYSNASQPTQTVSAPAGPSRFTQSAPAKPKQEVEPAAEKPAAPIFARVFDEEVESPGITQPEVATIDASLSPIFACRLLGLRATKSEANTLR